MTTNRMFAFGIGAAFGAIIGILIAPRSGKQTRDAIAESADTARGKLNEYKSAAANKLQDANGWVHETASTVGEKVKNLPLPMGSHNSGSEDGRMTD